MTKPAISIKGLTKNYGDFQALKGIDLEIKQGEFFGLLGPNGAGKTTLIKILTGLANITSGEVMVMGHDVIKDYRNARAQIGLVPQEFNFDQFIKLKHLLVFNAGFFGIPKAEAEKRSEKLFKELGLWEKRESQIRELSGGQKRRAMIARALVHKPKVIILDEPTAGVDVEVRRTMWKFIRKLNEEGVTILLTTHYIEEAQELCDRIAIINHGEIIACDKTSSLMKLIDDEVIVLHFEKKQKNIPRVLQKYNAKLENKGMMMRICINTTKHSYKKLIDDIAKTNLPIASMTSAENKLEEVFLKLTGIGAKK